ncbi:MAG: hypothetical protein [Bacteriophage sp.]|nr:MAG: hypothetical protein [Bacteriophage sp.]
MVEKILNILFVVGALLFILGLVYGGFKISLVVGIIAASILLTLTFGFIGVYYHDEKRKK